MAFYAVNIYSFREPNMPVLLFEPEVAGSPGYRGHSTINLFCNRQVAILADSREEAIEKAKCVEVRCGGWA